MSFNPVLSKRTLILVQLAQGPITRGTLAKNLGYSAIIGISKEVNKLMEDGKIVEDSKFRCPHCNEELEGIPLKKEGKLLRLTETGETEASQAKATLLKMVGGP